MRFVVRRTRMQRSDLTLRKLCWSRFRVGTWLLAGLLGLAVALGPSSSIGGDVVHRIGYLTLDPALIHGPFMEAFRSGLREAGYIEGRNIDIEWRFAGYEQTLLPVLVSELIRLKVEVLVTDGTQPSLAAKHATRMIPIVVATSGDTVAVGLVESLAHPGGNVTGLTLMSPGLMGKRLALLKEIAPRIRRVAMLLNPENASSQFQLKDAQAAASDLAVQLHPIPIRRLADVDRAEEYLVGRADALLIADDPLLDSLRDRVGAFAIQNRLPSICGYRVPADQSCLMWYGPDLLSLFRGVAGYVGRILSGAKPGDLPVEQPTKFRFAINARTANAIALVVPPSMLIAADEVIR